MELVCEITKADGSKPLKTAVVAPNCNVLHTAFEAVRVYLNEKCITPSPGYYNLKTYIQQTLSFASSIKASLLEGQGYYADVSGFFDNTTDANSGFYHRNKIFREDYDTTNGEYREARFFGKLNTDLISCETGLLPGTKVRIELDKAPSAFVLTKPSSDSEKYIFKINAVNLYVPVAQLSLPVFNQLNSLHAEKSVSIHYRKTEVREVPLPKDKVEYVSDNLFPDDVPCRIVVCLIKNDRKLGNYQNPYDFRRHWEVVSRAQTVTENDDNVLRERISQLEQTLSMFLEDSVSEPSPSRGKGKGKRSTSFAKQLMNRFRQSRPEDDGASTSSHASSQPSLPPPYTEVQVDATKRIYVRKIELLLNGSPLGNF